MRPNGQLRSSVTKEVDELSLNKHGPYFAATREKFIIAKTSRQPDINASGVLMRDILVELGRIDDLAFRELGYTEWSEPNQLSAKNNAYIYQAVMETLRRHSPPVDRFEARSTSRAK